MNAGRETKTVRFAESLRSSINPDGGWGYSAGKASRLEPTCWALLALLEQAPGNSDRPLVDAGIDRIARWQRGDGLAIDVPNTPPNFAFNGLAVVAVNRAMAVHQSTAESHGRRLRAMVEEIERAGGIQLGPSQNNRQDNKLVGWPWNTGTFSWTEPTSWCLLALKKTRSGQTPSAAAGRIREAERMLVDRCCRSGGWNYGNSNMLGKELHPYVPTTCLALLALQDRRTLPEAVRSREWLAANWRHEPSAMALSLALIALNVFHEPTEELERTLVAQFVTESPPDDLAVSALTLYVLSGQQHGWAAFTL